MIILMFVLVSLVSLIWNSKHETLIVTLNKNDFFERDKINNLLGCSS